MTSGDTAVTYTYGADGLRLSKTVDGVTHHYVYSGGKLVEETFGNIEMQFIYDAQGYPMMVCLTRGSEQPLYYHYVVNLQGDVIRILKPNGAVCVTYQYDAWGNITRTGGPDTGLAQWNPLRYRGYVYDTETGLYYLQSRYYNPKVGRFINADGYVATGQGFVGNNMFAYCLNNPVNFVDRQGCSSTSFLPDFVTSATEINLAMKQYKDAMNGIASISKSERTLKPGDLPFYGEPGSHAVSPDGTKERIYGPDGRPAKDRHHNDHGNPKEHPEVPHDHDWGYTPEGNWEPQPWYKSPDGPLTLSKPTPQITFDYLLEFPSFIPNTDDLSPWEMLWEILDVHFTR